MKHLPWLLIITSMTILQACKHPLAIEGEGDIVELSGTERGCTLEQFLNGDAACTENEVNGKYFVDYLAKPRAGWRFVRWEGPCSPGSDFQHCGLELSAEDVARWDATYPEIEIPPSKAVFEPVAGSTGYLVGPGIAGVSYQTPTLQGITGVDGSFQYRAGETVRFSIGDTVLGKVPGQPQVTVFDLAGSAVLTGFELNRALERERDDLPPISLPSVVIPNSDDWLEPLHIVVNLAVLLQSLDHDGDPGNGITIAQGVAKLLNGVRLEIDVPWWEFQSRLELHNLVARANNKARFSTPHGLVPPALAMANLYQSLGIEPHTYGVTWEQINGQAEEDVRTITSRYDGAGYLLTREKIFADGSPQVLDSWRYDPLGNPINFESSRFGAVHRMSWRYDAFGNLLGWERDDLGDGAPESMARYLYKKSGYLARYELDEDADGVAQFSVEWQYNSRGVVKQRAYSEVRDEISHQSGEQWWYDQHGRLIHYRSETSEDLPEWLPEGSEFTNHYEFSDGGEVVTKEQRLDGNGDGLIDRTTRWRYDSNGNMIHYESNGDVPSWWRSNPNRTVDYHYDAENRLIREVVDRDSDGAVDSVIRYHYDAAGKLISLKEDVDDNGTLDGVDRWLYNDAGQVTRYERRNDGHLFSIEERRYDTVGNLVYSSDDWRADGIVEEEIQLDYSADGGSIRAKLIYRDYKGLTEDIVTRVYSPTGWGHLFLLLPTSEPQDYRYAQYDPL